MSTPPEGSIQPFLVRISAPFSPSNKGSAFPKCLVRKTLGVKNVEIQKKEMKLKCTIQFLLTDFLSGFTAR